MSAENLEKDILNRSVFYSFSLYTRMFIKIISGILIAKFLGPHLYGLKNTYDLALDYEGNSDLGTFDALNKQIPYYRGENDLLKASEAFSSIFWINIIYAGITSVIIVLISQYLKLKGMDQQYVDLIFFIGLAIFTGKLCSFLDTRLQINKQHFLLGKVEIVYGITASVMGVSLAYLYSLRGALLSLVMADLIFIFLIMSHDKSIPNFKVSFKIFWDLLKIGLPINILFLLFMLFDTADRAIILAMLSAESLGYYSIAIVAISAIEIIPGAVHSVTFAPVMEKYGKTKSRESIRNYFTDPTIILAYFMPVVMSFLFFAIHLPIQYYLEEFSRSILIVKILVLGIYFSAVSYPSISISLAFNKQTALLKLIIPLVGLNYCLNYTFVKAGWELEGVAVATGIAYFFQFCVLTFFVTVQFGDSFGKYIANVATVMLPFLYTLTLLFGIEILIGNGAMTLYEDILITAGKIGLFIFFYGILIFWNRKHPSIIKLLKNIKIMPQKTL